MNENTIELIFNKFSFKPVSKTKILRIADSNITVGKISTIIEIKFGRVSVGEIVGEKMNTRIANIIELIIADSFDPKM